jgi:acetoin utilization protein AcuB
MSLRELIQYELPSLGAHNTVLDAKKLFLEFRVSGLPYLLNYYFIGNISEESIADLSDELLLSDLPFSMPFEKVNEELSFIDVVKIFLNAEIDVLPLTKANGEFLGCISKNMIFHKFIEGLSLNYEGGIIEVKLKPDYSFTELAKIIEQEHAHILSMFLFGFEAEEKSIILKLDSPKISYLVLSLERYGYEVLSYFSTEQVSSIEKDRYDLLMKYLSI